MNITKIKLPIEQIGAGVKTAKKAIADQMDIMERVHALGSEDDARKYSGENGVQERARELEKAEAERMAIVEAAQKKLAELHSDALEMIEQQTDPQGADVTGANAGDFALLEKNLIETPEKLERLIAKHNNAAFRIAAERYAADPARKWPGFAYLPLEKSCIEYTNSVFRGLSGAAERPTGLFAMQYTQQKDEFKRMAAAYGLADVFTESGGDELENLFIR